MSESAPRTQQLLKALSELPVPSDEEPRAGRRRDQAVARITGLLQEKHRAKRRQRWMPAVAAVLAAASVILVVAGVRALRQPHDTTSVVAAAPAARARAIEGTVLFARDGALQPVAVQADTALQSGDELRTAAQGGATIALATGVVINMGPATTLSIGAVQPDLAPGNHDVVLTLGRVDVTVPKLPAGSSFAVRTPDTEVIVHGTRFSVMVSSSATGAPTLTGVQVTEGRVSVVHAGSEQFLNRGETWSSVAPAPRTSEADVTLPAPPSGSGRQPELEPAPGKTSAAKPSPQSSLAEENRLFQSAMEAKRAGNDRKVVATLDQLIGTYPSSPLAPNARVERFRALKRLGDEAAAAREARRYLAENPDGFARDEARDTVIAPTPSSSRPTP